MNVHQLIYVSRLTNPLSNDTLRALVAQSESDNALMGVTGQLMVHGCSVMQLLEGDVQTVERLFARIARDSRHRDVAALMRKTVNRRLYPEWGMGLTDLRSPLELDRPRMIRMLDDLRAASDTRAFTVEARVLVREFEQQARLAA